MLKDKSFAYWDYEITLFYYGISGRWSIRVRKQSDKDFLVVCSVVTKDEILKSLRADFSFLVVERIQREMNELEKSNPQTQ